MTCSGTWHTRAPCCVWPRAARPRPRPRLRPPHRATPGRSSASFRAAWRASREPSSRWTASPTTTPRLPRSLSTSRPSRPTTPSGRFRATRADVCDNGYEPRSMKTRIRRNGLRPEITPLKHLMDTCRLSIPSGTSLSYRHPPSHRLAQQTLTLAGKSTMLRLTLYVAKLVRLQCSRRLLLPLAHVTN